MQTQAILAGDNYLATLRELAATCQPDEAAALAARIRSVRDLAANACSLWQQTVECAGASTWTGYSIPVEQHYGPSPGV